MSEYKYTFQNYNPETMSKIVGRGLKISTKQSIEICNFIRGKKIERAKAILEDAIALRKPIPFKRFNADVGHKRGPIGPGRFAVNASKEILNLIKGCESNAQFKGLNTEGMILIHINAHRGAQQWHYGRLRRRKMKQTHVEVVLEESSKKPRTKVKPTVEKTQTEVKKTETKPVPKDAVKETKPEVKGEQKKTEEKVVEKKVEDKKPVSESQSKDQPETKPVEKKE